jgi:response regulator RpfG family c-di-GMP phosphodiesterase
MELAYLAELRDDALVLHDVDGAAAAYAGVGAGARVPREYSWCHAMVAEEAPRLVPDTAAVPGADAHPFVRSVGIRAYVGAPVRREDGTVFGTLCCLARSPRPALDERDLRSLDAFARLAADRLAAAADSLARRRAELQAEAGQALVAALNARENYTAEHSEAVLELALEVGAELGLDEAELGDVGRVALLHDIGKVGVPDAVLRKAGALTEREWDVMREHPAIGARIVAAIPSLAHLAPAVRAEHERWDGRGYPDGLAGTAVPLASRICLVCDAWHAMTTDRPYRRALCEADACAELERHAGAQFCPDTTHALLRVLERRAGPPQRRYGDTGPLPYAEPAARV